MNERVIIVDDSLTVRMDLTEAFIAAGFEVVPCATAAAAREAIAAGPVAIAVFDVVLPDASGVDLVIGLRALPTGKEAVILMLSSAAEVQDRLRGLQTGADDYVGKPYDRAYVVARARELLQARQAVLANNRVAILVIDDSQTFRETLRDSLTAAGYAVLTAADGEDGLRIAAHSRPQAVIVDGMLPGIDGTTVIRRLRLDHALRNVPCLLLTACDDNHAELHALDAGADAFVRKGEPIEIILTRIAVMLRREVPAPAADARSTLGTKKILAVDDNMTYLQALAEALRGEGYDVVPARSGEEAMEHLGMQRFDCILLDLIMPGIDGQETCRRIKAAPTVRDIPLIMLTALEDHAAMIQGLGAGADDYIAKTSDFEVLKARVRAQLRRRQSENENQRIREELLMRELEAAEARASRDLAATRAVLVEELERKNQELEAFSYSVSHDLRAPLRAIDGFSKALLDGHGPHLDATGQHYLARIRAGTTRMSQLIDDLLNLSRVSRLPLQRSTIDLSAMVKRIIADLCERHAGRVVEVDITAGVTAFGDPRLLEVVFENLLGNAWKFTAKQAAARITFVCEAGTDGPVYRVRDNGAGFDMAFASKLFAPFHRLHREADFSGTGIGLATVRRIIGRHGGQIWAEAAVDAGATFSFTLGTEMSRI